MITTYSELVEAIGDWLDRDDLAERASTFVQLAEARLNRLLEDPEMEVTSTITATGDATALPADFGEMVSISTGTGALIPVPPGQFATYGSERGEPRYYSISDGALSFYPRNATAPITLVYRRRILKLSEANPTNWLLNLAPDAYLYGALVQAEGFLAEDDRVAGWKALFDEAIGELRIDANRRKYGVGPLRPRIRRP